MIRKTRFLFVAVLAALAVWTVFAWPLPRYFFAGIPSANRNLEKGHTRYMIPGDHLQLLYHFWLASDTIAGRTEFFRNPYEFNTGDDKTLLRPTTYYIPFSLVSTFGVWIGGKAFGWNLAGLVSIIVSFIATWLLVRRYATREPVAFLAALIGTTLPYRWVTLLCGSPTGFGMALVPVFLLALDSVVKSQRVLSAVAAAFVLLLAFCADMHSFYFCVMAMPVWCLITSTWAWKIGGGKELFSSRYRHLITAMIVLAVLVVAVLGLSSILIKSYSSAGIGGGRTWKDVALQSPPMRGLFTWKIEGVANHAFIGVTLAALLGIGLIAAAIRHRNSPGNLIAVLLLTFSIICAICLALGVNGPFGGALMDFARKYVPRYTMIRQPVKIFVLMPSFAAVLAGIGMESLIMLAGPRKLAAGILMGVSVLLAGAVVTEHKFQVDPTICLLRESQGAYAAVRDDADARGKAPRAVIIPLWPGDSHFASLYEYYASMYHIRMLNGYSPVKDKRYFHEVFAPLEIVNTGALSDWHIEKLAGMGIDYIILHEDPFPQKVTRDPAALTLKRFLEHPKLVPLGRCREVWAFRIVNDPAIPSGTKADPAKKWEIVVENGRSLKDNESMEIPAPVSFNTGYTDIRDNGVVFLADDDPAVCVLRTPLVPFYAGDYEIRTRYKTAAGTGIELGVMTLAVDGIELSGVSIRGKDGSEDKVLERSFECKLEKNCTPELRFTFLRNGDVKILSFTVTCKKVSVEIADTEMAKSKPKLKMTVKTQPTADPKRISEPAEEKQE